MPYQPRCSQWQAPRLFLDLLQQWCDALCRLQVRGFDGRGLAGGILCPACSRIHGRCADAVYPLVYLAHRTGRSQYLDAAVSLQRWSEHVSRQDGSWVNEVESDWKAITVFGAISLAEALRLHGQILDSKVRVEWMDRLRRAGEFLYRSINISTGAINYPAACARAMAILGKLFDEARYMSRAGELAHEVMKYFSEANVLLFGEGRPQDGLSPSGCRAVDIGYNVESSLPSLAVYGLLTADQEVIELVVRSLRTHLAFMLPDGGWDDSFGTRIVKWSYWGSRTSDGCHPAYALLADREPSFLAAACQNVELLAKCTKEGILHGGPHYIVRGVLPCIHHTFCHANSLATTLDHLPKVLPPTNVPEELIAGARGLRYFPEINTWLVNKTPWRATVTAYDFEHLPETHPSGGALSLLYHQDAGLLLVSSMTVYRMWEQTNQQAHREGVCLPLTPRLAWSENGRTYYSINDTKATVHTEKSPDQITLVVNGRLVDEKHNDPPSGQVPFQLGYCFTTSEVRISWSTEARDPGKSVELVLPVVSPNDEPVVSISDQQYTITKPGGRVVIETTAASSIQMLTQERIFNHVPGIEAIPFSVRCLPQRDENAWLRIMVIPT